MITRPTQPCAEARIDSSMVGHLLRLPEDLKGYRSRRAFSKSAADYKKIASPCNGLRTPLRATASSAYKSSQIEPKAHMTERRYL